MIKMVHNPTPKRVILLMLLFSFFAVDLLKAQSFKVSEVSMRFMNDNDYDSLLYALTIPIALQKDIAESELKTRYLNNRNTYIETLRPLLQNGFAILDKNYQKATVIHGSPSYSYVRLGYLIKTKEILQTVLKGTSLLSGLFSKNYNDRILKFHSDITVMPSGKLAVSEFITVFNGDGKSNGEGSSTSSTNDDIQRGIVREIPTKYIDKNGFWSETGFQVRGAFKNGEAEPYTKKSTKFGVSIRLGKKDVFLPPGIFQYKIDYESERQLLFHPDKDELYWNVNGNGWAFTADSVSCLVRFPKGANIKEYACYTGLQGSRRQDCAATVLNDSTILLSASKGLAPFEGLTVGISIQKGIVLAPTKLDKDLAFLKANYMLPVLAVVLLFLLCFYYIAWSRKGRDPVASVIYPRFSPPSGLSPADLGYILDQRYRPHLFTAAILDFSIKKHLDIEVKQEGKSPTYHFKRPSASTEVPDTKSTYGFNVDSLYGQSVKQGTYNEHLKSCNDSLASKLKDRFLIRKGKPNSLYGAFRLNKGYTRFGGFLLLFCLVGSLIFLAGHPSRVLLLIVVLMILAIIILQIVFARIMGAYTPEGRDVADHILGFKMYLEQSEQQAFETSTPGENAVALFEKFLPYAIALKVSNEWTSKFNNIMERAVEGGYEPGYYIAGFNVFNMHNMNRDISSGLSGSISSASTPPSSSDGGSGGGGSSGGGGGGGGGGGW